MAEESAKETSPAPTKLSPQDARKALQNAEERYQGFIAKRTEFNAQAAALREERDELNGAKKQAFDELNAMKKERQKTIEELKKHRDKRNLLQQRAKQLIAHKQSRTKRSGKKTEVSAQELRHKVKDLDKFQQTANLSLEEERALLERMKRLYGDLKDQEKEEEALGEVAKEISELNATIDELFQQADEEHAQVVKCSKAADAMRAKEKETYFSITHLISESDKKHKEFIEARKRADHNHQRAMELRETMSSIRKEQWQERDQQRRAIRDHNQRTRRGTGDKKALDKAADDSLAELMKSGKIKL